MIPSLMMIGVGRGCRYPLPLPLFLLWPLIALAGLVLALCLPFAPSDSTVGRRIRAGWQALRAFAQIRGLKIDVLSKDGERVLIWFV